MPKSPEPHLVSKDHEPIVCLAPDGAAHTLGCMAHGIEGEEVILPDLELVPQILQPGLGDEEAEVESLSSPHTRPPTHTQSIVSPTHLENSALGVDIGNAKHDDSPPIVVHWGQERRITVHAGLAGAKACA